ncbi:unnamed protein product [Trifolium pratense]|uniref:Uncharacterized protein n=1 Tax=Trifolium pratense TaxID=57577 RepID=A0ACB0J1M1_TRIPR|nr:unnamed protein product [Trifolium pratense]
MMMAGSKGDGENDGASYQSPTEEKLTPISSSSTTPDNSIDAPSLPTLPFDLVTEILCWIPVKFFSNSVASASHGIISSLKIPNFKRSTFGDTRPIPFPTFVKVIIPIVGLTRALEAAEEVVLC